MLLIFFHFLVARKNVVSRDDFLPAGLVGFAVVMALGIVDQQLFLPLRDGVRLGDGGQQCPGVGVQGMGEQLLAFCQFHDFALVDDGDAVTDEANYGQVVGDEQIRQAPLFLQLGQQVQHLGTDGHVQGGNGLVGNSFYWALLGAFYYFVIHPRVVEALTWFAQNLAFSFVVGMFYGVFLVDLVSSLGIVAKVRRFAIDNQIQIRYEELKQEIRENAEARAAEREEKLARLRFLLPFQSEVPLGEHLRKYGELHDAFGVTPQEFFDELQDKVADKVDAAKDSLREALQDADMGGRGTGK